VSVCPVHSDSMNGQQGVRRYASAPVPPIKGFRAASHLGTDALTSRLPQSGKSVDVDADRVFEATLTERRMARWARVHETCDAMAIDKTAFPPHNRDAEVQPRTRALSKSYFTQRQEFHKDWLEEQCEDGQAKGRVEEEGVHGTETASSAAGSPSKDPHDFPPREMPDKFGSKPWHARKRVAGGKPTAHAKPGTGQHAAKRVSRLCRAVQQLDALRAIRRGAHAC